MSARSTTSSEAIVELLKSVTEEIPGELDKYCQSSTLRMLREASKQSEEVVEIP